MSPTNENILSLSFSKNRFGFAIFRHGHLDYYATRTLTRFRTARDRNRGINLTLDTLVKDHTISKLAFPKLNKQQRHSQQLGSLYRAVRRFCKKNHLAVITQDPVQMRRKLTGDDKPSKENVRTRLLQIFPELKRFSSGGIEWERRYYDHIFTAIASGMVAAGFAAAGSREGVIE